MAQVISSKAVETFMKMKGRNYFFLKKKSEAFIDAQLTKLKPQPDFYTTPMLHQKVCFLIAAYHARWMFSCDVGTGKSKLALDIINYRKKKNKAGRFLVLVKNEIAIDDFIIQIQTHAPNLKAVKITGTYEEKLDAIFKEEGDIYIAHYPGFTHMCSIHKQSKKLLGISGKKGQWETNHRVINWVIQRIDGIVFDEIHKIRGWNSLPHRICRKIADNVRFVFALTGTPMGKNAQHLWAELRVVDLGETLGRTLTLFRAGFFNEKEKFWGGYEYTLKANLKNKLHHRIANRSIRYSSNECFDLPPVVRIPIKIKMPEESMAYYRELEKELRRIYKDYKAAEGIFIRMRQIASGYLGAKIDEDKIEISFPHNPKMEALISLLEDIGEDKKVIIVHEFRHSNKEICKALRKEKIPHVSIMGGTKNATALLREFQYSKKTNKLVGNWASIGESLNIQQADYLIYYETPVDPIYRKQCDARVDRYGQTAEVVYIYDLIMLGTVEVGIQKNLKTGRNFFKEIIEGRGIRRKPKLKPKLKTRTKR